MIPAVQEALQRLSRFANKPLVEYKNIVSREICNLTNSTLAYFATYDSDKGILTMIAWSVSAMINCSMIDKPVIYKIEETGLWGDAVREKKAVITNDYPNLVKKTKKGYPKGHVKLNRHLNLPIRENNRTVLVVGVGNKTSDYVAQDIQVLEEFMTEVWKTLKTKL